MAGPVDSTGATKTHWFTSGIAFTLIMHVIAGKLAIETVYWNWISGLVNIACVLFYYICVLGGNVAPVANIFQPEIGGQYNEMVSNGKAWIVLIVLPIVALLPDLIYMLMQKIFFPTPTDAVMVNQAMEPGYEFDGFNDVFKYQLPNDIQFTEDITLPYRPRPRLSPSPSDQS